MCVCVCVYEYIYSPTCILKSRAVARFIKRSRSRPEALDSLTTAASKRSSWKMSAGTILASCGAMDSG